MYAPKLFLKKYLSVYMHMSHLHAYIISRKAADTPVASLELNSSWCNLLSSLPFTLSLHYLTGE